MDLKVMFKKPYDFEGTIYHEVDLSGLEDLTGKDLREVELMVLAKGQSPVAPEQTINGANALACKCTEFPTEFFENLPLADAMAVRNTIMGFLR